MTDMKAAVERIELALQRKEKIAIYGDYDVDGVCATSILLETLREMGADPAFRIPSRHGEGYGLNCDAVREMAESYRQSQLGTVRSVLFETEKDGKCFGYTMEYMHCEAKGDLIGKTVQIKMTGLTKEGFSGEIC